MASSPPASKWLRSPVSSSNRQHERGAYRTIRKGDIMRLARSDSPCACGRAMARLLVGLLAPIVLLLSTAEHASAQTLVHVRDTGVLRVGYRQDAQPFSYQDAAAGAKGYSVVLCQKIADALKEKLQLP